jgi:hypothetical protein
MKTATIDVTITLSDTAILYNISNIKLPNNSDGTELRNIIKQVILEYSDNNYNKAIEKILIAAQDGQLVESFTDFDVKDIEFCVDHKFIELSKNNKYKITFNGILWLTQFSINACLVGKDNI